MVHLKTAVVDVVNTYAPKGLKAVAISSNSTQTHPQDGPENMALDAKVRQVIPGLGALHWPTTDAVWVASIRFATTGSSALRKVLDLHLGP